MDSEAGKSLPPSGGGGAAAETLNNNSNSKHARIAHLKRGAIQTTTRWSGLSVAQRAAAIEASVREKDNFQSSPVSPPRIPVRSSSTSTYVSPPRKPVPLPKPNTPDAQRTPDGSPSSGLKNDKPAARRLESPPALTILTRDRTVKVSFSDALETLTCDPPPIKSPTLQPKPETVADPTVADPTEARECVSASTEPSPSSSFVEEHNSVKLSLELVVSEQQGHPATEPVSRKVFPADPTYNFTDRLSCVVLSLRASRYDEDPRDDTMADTSSAEGMVALPRLEDILRTPEDLEKIPALKTDFTRKKAAVDSQFRDGLRQQLETVQAGMNILAEGKESIALTRDEQEMIEKLCLESQAGVKDFSQIDRLAKMERRFAASLFMKEGLETFHEKLGALERLLEDDDDNLENQPNLLPAHKAVTELRDFRDEAMDQIRNLKVPDESSEATLTDWFKNLDPAIEWFDDHLGTACMNLIPLVQGGNPGLVVRLAIIVKKEEDNDAQVRALQDAKKDHQELASRFKSITMGPKTIRGYKEKFIQAIEFYAKAQFDATREKFLDDPSKMEKQFKWYFNDLFVVREGMQNLMPRKWKIFSTYTKIYHKMMHDWLIEIIDNPDVPPANHLAIIHWSEKYYGKMKKLGWKMEELEPHLIDDRESELVRKWRDIIVNALDEWIDRMFTTDRRAFLDKKADALDTDANGFFRSKTLSDMWRMLHEQVVAAGSSDRTDVAEGVFEAMFRALKQRQSSWQTLTDEECAKFANVASPEQAEGIQIVQDWLVALANDQIACVDDDEENDQISYLTRFQRDLEPLATSKWLASRGFAELDALRDGYLDLATHCLTSLTSLIFNVDLKSTLLEFFTSEWYGKFAMKRITSTFDDYMSDYGPVLHPSLRDILAEEFSDKLLISYLGSIRKKGVKFRRQDPWTDKFKDDVLTAFAFFQQFADSFPQIKQKWRAVDWLVRFLEADKVGVVAVYEQCKMEYWDLQLSWVEAVLRSRDDFERSMISQVKAKAAGVSVEVGPETIMGKVR